jgi:ring-1,2-phenylacetyl-CoA epoxidase subunit PaaC
MLQQLRESDPDTLAFRRDPQDFRNATLTALPRKDWARSIMRQFLYDAAEHVRLEAYSNHPFEPLAQFARKIRGEEKYHFLHGRTWISKLGHGTDESRQRLQESLDELWPYALGLFEPSQNEQPEPFDEATLRSEWLQLICPLLSDASLTVDAAENADGIWTTVSNPIYGRYDEPDEHRIDLLDAMQKVYRLDPDAQW